ncbi:MAG: hypothetical protein PQ964_07260 [Methanobacteriaceae archaeon]|jgi:hypothetical protein
MLKIERTCSSLKCDVLLGDRLIGHMDGVNLTQWFLKNKYVFKGSFSRFTTFNARDCQVGMIVDIVFADKKLIIRNARIEWIRESSKNGTFNASKIDYYDPSFKL